MAICPFCHFERSDSGSRSPKLPCDRSATNHSTNARCSPCARVAVIDAKIEQARQNLLDMQAERLRLLIEVNHTHDQFIERFPVEMISSIFQHCLSDLDTLSNSTNGRIASVPLRLSQVSRRWRTIAHSIPQLWTILPLYVKESEEFSLKAIYDVAREWLGRSGKSKSLAIILDIDGKVDVRARHSQTVFDALKNYAGRVRHFHIKASDPILHHLCCLGGTMSTLRISCVKEQWASFEPHYHLDSGCGTLEPEHLYIDGTTRTSFHISLSRLTHLEVRQTPFSDVFTILRDAPHLVSFNFARPTNYREPVLPPKPLVRSSLRHLYLHDRMYTQLYVFLLAAFAFPSLQSLGLEHAGRHSTPVTNVIDHIRRSGSQLQKLSVHGVNSDDITHSSVLAELIGPVTGRSLRYLDVATNWGPWDTRGECLQLAAIVEAASAYLPNLRTLRLYAGEQGWLHVLQKLLSASSALTSLNGQPLSVTLWFSGLPIPIDERSRGLELDAIYDEKPPLTAAELRDMMSTMKHHLISVVLSHRPWPYYLPDDAKDAVNSKDITELILVTLARLLHDSRSKQLGLK